jgi:LysR family glycine cleavage system transcriptional activator
VIASELLARDLLQRGVLSAPFSNALPGARYYLVTTEAAAQRADIIALREWLVGQMASGDGGHPARDSGLTSRRRWSLHRTRSRERY